MARALFPLETLLGTFDNASVVLNIYELKSISVKTEESWSFISKFSQNITKPTESIPIESSNSIPSSSLSKEGKISSSSTLSEKFREDVAASFKSSLQKLHFHFLNLQKYRFVIDLPQSRIRLTALILRWLTTASIPYLSHKQNNEFILSTILSIKTGCFLVLSCFLRRNSHRKEFRVQNPFSFNSSSIQTPPAIIIFILQSLIDSTYSQPFNSNTASFEIYCLSCMLPFLKENEKIVQRILHFLDHQSSQTMNDGILETLTGIGYALPYVHGKDLKRLTLSFLCLWVSQNEKQDLHSIFLHLPSSASMDLTSASFLPPSPSPLFLRSIQKHHDLNSELPSIEHGLLVFRMIEYHAQFLFKSSSSSSTTSLSNHNQMNSCIHDLHDMIAICSEFIHTDFNSSCFSSARSTSVMVLGGLVRTLGVGLGLGSDKPNHSSMKPSKHMDLNLLFDSSSSRLTPFQSSSNEQWKREVASMVQLLIKACSIACPWEIPSSSSFSSSSSLSSSSSSSLSTSTVTFDFLPCLKPHLHVKSSFSSSSFLTPDFLSWSPLITLLSAHSSPLLNLPSIPNTELKHDIESRHFWRCVCIVFSKLHHSQSSLSSSSSPSPSPSFIFDPCVLWCLTSFLLGDALQLGILFESCMRLMDLNQKSQSHPLSMPMNTFIPFSKTQLSRSDSMDSTSKEQTERQVPLNSQQHTESSSNSNSNSEAYLEPKGERDDAIPLLNALLKEIGSHGQTILSSQTPSLTNVLCEQIQNADEQTRRCVLNCVSVYVTCLYEVHRFMSSYVFITLHNHSQNPSSHSFPSSLSHPLPPSPTPSPSPSPSLRFCSWWIELSPSLSFLHLSPKTNALLLTGPSAVKHISTSAFLSIFFLHKALAHVGHNEANHHVWNAYKHENASPFLPPLYSFSVQFIQNLSYLEFCRVEIGDDYSSFLQSLVFTILDKKEFVFQFLSNSPSVSDLADCRGLLNAYKMQYDWKKDVVLLHRLNFYLRLFPFFVSKISASLFSSFISPIIFQCILHPDNGVCISSHKIFSYFLISINEREKEKEKEKEKGKEKEKDKKKEKEKKEKKEKDETDDIDSLYSQTTFYQQINLSVFERMCIEYAHLSIQSYPIITSLNALSLCMRSLCTNVLCVKTVTPICIMLLSDRISHFVNMIAFEHASKTNLKEMNASLLTKMNTFTLNNFENKTTQRKGEAENSPFEKKREEEDKDGDESLSQMNAGRRSNDNDGDDDGDDGDDDEKVDQMILEPLKILFALFFVVDLETLPVLLKEIANSVFECGKKEIHLHLLFSSFFEEASFSEDYVRKPIAISFLQFILSKCGNEANTTFIDLMDDAELIAAIKKIMGESSNEGMSFLTTKSIQILLNNLNRFELWRRKSVRNRKKRWSSSEEHHLEGGEKENKKMENLIKIRLSSKL